MDITIVGLGPGAPDLLTREAWRVLSSANEVWLRTRRHPVVEGLPDGPTYHSFDYFYERYDTFPEVYTAIVDQVVELGRRDNGVVYAVPGHPLVGEVAVRQILARAASEGLSVHVVAGVSFIEPMLTALRVDPLNAGLQIVDAEVLARQHHPIVNVDLPLIVPQVYSQHLASDVKLTLLNAYPPDHELTLVSSAGHSNVVVQACALSELDHEDVFTDWTTVYVPPVPVPGSVDAYHEIIAHLRSPEGCPWDREQTHQSLRHNLLEETYEVLDAIDSGDVNTLREELGDLLMQVLFHTQMAAEGGDFTLPEVVADSIEKLIRRHPHVFGDAEIATREELLQVWEKIKAEERSEKAEGKSSFDGVPTVMPALAQAQEIQRRAARLGFDWPDVDGVWEKVHEELGELRAADASEQALELSDVLFSLVNLARWLDVDAEDALRRGNRRFVERFEAMERLAKERGQTWWDLSLEEMDHLWESIKGHT